LNRGTDNGPVFYIHANGRFTLDAGTGGVFRALSNKVVGSSDLNAWMHVVVVINSSTDPSLWQFYVNGVNNGVDSSGAGGTYTNPGPAWAIGTIFNSGLFFNGLIDETRIYNRALSAGKVNKLYQTGR